MSTITKTNIVKNIADQTGQSLATVNEVVEKLLAEINTQTEAGQSVNFNGFGKFERRERAARTGRNPSTGEPVEIAASTNLAFKAAKAMKAAA